MEKSLIKSVLEIVGRHRPEDWGIDSESPFLADGETTIRFDIFSLVAALKIEHGGEAVEGHFSCPLLPFGCRHELFQELSKVLDHLKRAQRDRMAKVQREMAARMLDKA